MRSRNWSSPGRFLLLLAATHAVQSWTSFGLSPASLIEAERVGERNSCSELDLEDFKTGAACAPPLAYPCFDFSCLAAANTSRPKIYVFDAECSLSDSDVLPTAWEDAPSEKHIDWVFRKAARQAGVLAETYESACLFMHVTRGEKRRCAADSPLWNQGLNHVMVDFGDTGREARPEVADSYAMDASSNMHACIYRSGFDVSLPLGPERHFPELAEVAASDRRFFLTNKGTVYLSGHGSEERLSVLPLHDEDQGVVMSLRCFDKHGEDLLPENADFCRMLSDRYDDHDYESLMNTTFALVPAGRSPGTYRLAEAMGGGAIPVVVGRDFVLPFREQFDWPSFSFTFAPDQAGPEMMRALRAMPPDVLNGMQRKSLEAYRRMFGADHSLLGPYAFKPIARRLVSILVRRLEHRGGR